MDGGSDPFGLIGQVLDGQFRVDKFVGEGGFSVVYKGHHLGLAAPIAIKCLKLPPQVNASLVESFMHRFRDESRLYYQLSQGNLSIVRSISSGTAAGPTTGATIPYMILEWLEGRSLGQDFEERRIRKFTGRTLEEVFDLFSGAADGIGYAHAQGVVHRDMNPGNIFIVEDKATKKTKVLDFGVAKILRETTLELASRAQTLGAIRIFAPAYGAPEQFDDRVGEIGPWTDVYGFSLMLVEALRDKTVMEGEHIGDYARQALDPNVRPTPRTLGLTVPDEIEQVFARSFKISPKERWQNAQDFWIVFRNAIRMAKHKGFAPTETVPLSSGVLKNELAKKQSEKKLEAAPPVTMAFAATASGPAGPASLGVGAPAISPAMSQAVAQNPPPTSQATSQPAARESVSQQAVAPKNESSLASTMAMSSIVSSAIAAGLAPTPAAPSVIDAGPGPNTRRLQAGNASTVPAPALNATLAMGYRPSALPTMGKGEASQAVQAPAGMPAPQQQPSQASPQAHTQAMPMMQTPQPPAQMPTNALGPSMGTSPIQQTAMQPQAMQPQAPHPSSAPQLDDGSPRPSYGATMPINDGKSSKVPIIIAAAVAFVLIFSGIGVALYIHARSVAKGAGDVPSASISAMPSAILPPSIPSTTPSTIPADTTAAPSASASASSAPSVAPDTSASSAPDTSAMATATATSAPTATATATSAPTATATATSTTAPTATATAHPSATASAPALTAFNEKAARSKLDTYGGIVGGACHDAAGVSGPGTAHVTFGTDGKVSGITLDPPYAGTKQGTCVLGLLKRATAPSFQGAPATVTYKFSVDK